MYEIRLAARRPVEVECLPHLIKGFIKLSLSFKLKINIPFTLISYYNYGTTI